LATVLSLGRWTQGRETKKPTAFHIFAEKTLKLTDYDFIKYI